MKKCKKCGDEIYYHTTKTHDGMCTWCCESQLESRTEAEPEEVTTGPACEEAPVEEVLTCKMCGKEINAAQNINFGGQCTQCFYGDPDIEDIHFDKPPAGVSILCPSCGRYVRSNNFSHDAGRCITCVGKTYVGLTRNCNGCGRQLHPREYDAFEGLCWVCHEERSAGTKLLYCSECGEPADSLEHGMCEACITPEMVDHPKHYIVGGPRLNLSPETSVGVLHILNGLIKVDVAALIQLEAKSAELDRREKGAAVVLIDNAYYLAKCSHCNGNIHTREKYCFNCGTKLIWDSEVTP